jgi:4-alpha-glucanotransferase
MGESSLGLPRCSGVLLHVTSLPGRGIGDLGDAAYRWIDWLADAEQSVWQILPLVPINEGGSPYNGLSALGGNALLVSSERLAADGLLDVSEIGGDELPAERVDFPRVSEWKERLLRQAYSVFRRGAAAHLRPEFDAFRSRNADWLEDYALFRAVREWHGGAGWLAWDAPIRLRREGAVAEWRERLAESVEDHVFRQFLFHYQWQALRHYAHQRGVAIIGDLPIFVAHDSADVWAHRDLFSLDEDGLPTVVSGVPPDYFSVTGQRWGNPLYRWDVIAELGFPWWTQRFRRTFEQVDVVRVDHFRGFEAYWEIPAEEPTALNGRWVAGPRAELFEAVQRELGPLPIIAEDLGLITPEVDRLRQRLGFPGMRVLQFAFDGDPDNPHLPANHPAECVAYTGTHDNATAVEWWQEAGPAVRDQVRQQGPVHEERAHWDLISLTLASAARVAIVPLQDVLGLGAEARMNTPGTGPGNWSWRLDERALADAGPRQSLRDIARATARGARAAQP